MNDGQCWIVHISQNKKCFKVGGNHSLNLKAANPTLSEAMLTLIWATFESAKSDGFVDCVGGVIGLMLLSQNAFPVPALIQPGAVLRCNTCKVCSWNKQQSFMRCLISAAKVRVQLHLLFNQIKSFSQLSLIILLGGSGEKYNWSAKRASNGKIQIDYSGADTKCLVKSCDATMTCGRKYVVGWSSSLFSLLSDFCQPDHINPGP